MATTTATTAFPFPHPELTPIVGKPTPPASKLLKREVFANARFVHSTRGGGTNGYLALCMAGAPYVARSGVTFDLPVQPGPSLSMALAPPAPDHRH
jgi:hypothetical protein